MCSLVYIGRLVLLMVIWLNSVDAISRLTVDSLSTTSRASLQSIFAPCAASSTYKGPIFQFRRSSDDTLANFYSDGNCGLYATISGVQTYVASWLSPSYTAYVVTWYDQSGYGRNATQGTATLQPKWDQTNSVVDFRTAAYLITPAAIIPPGNGVYTLTSAVYSTDCSSGVCVLFAVGTATTNQETCIFIGSGSFYNCWYSNDAVMGIYSVNSIITATYDQSNRRGYINGVLQQTVPSTNHNMVGTVGYIGRAANDGFPLNGELYYIVTSNIVLPTVDRLLLEGIGQPTSQPSRQPSSRPTSPSSQPSNRPSTHPSSQPSSNPSQPSCQPSCQPSSQPTNQPSNQPTTQPSVQPSNHPTEQPSSRPSRQPSSNPSKQPSCHPSGQPSGQPNSRPSSQPTCQPTSQPSRQPLTRPSVQPTSQPTSQPSCRPSLQPATQPSRQPSSQPSTQPTSQPGRGPSCQPSRRPSTPPTRQPSCQPSTFPSSKPSRQPSGQPSIRPSRQPSSQPSSLPTDQPSVQPSGQPSDQPSRKPSNQPSNQPSVQPTAQPSRQPTSQPTGQPTFQPSARPSVQPTRQPSGQPSLQPSTQPTGQPSAKPSNQPSKAPTSQPSTKPSSQPFSQPSGLPSIQPSNQPLSHPSSYPSVQPRQQPSLQPVCDPSAIPTEQPIAYPSSHPSSQPRLDPTYKPTNMPTNQPISQPSKQPTGPPSRQPSAQPIGRPSRQPTSQPSCQPSWQPTKQPTIQPSVQPSRQPSVQPTCQPIAHPSLQPSGQPYSHPSMQPTKQPSSRPSRYPSCQPTRQPSTQPSSRPSSQPACVPPTADRIVRATLPGSMLSVIGDSHFRIILQYSQVALSNTGSAFSDIHIPVAGSFGSFALVQSNTLRNRSLLVTARDAYLIANALSFDSRGRSAAVLRDINGDGFDDVIIGDPFLSKCYVLFGSMNGLTNMTSGFTIIGALDGDLTGWSVSGAGDVNNDTMPDIIVGAPHSLGLGAFYVIYGRRDFADVYLRYLESWEGFVVYGARKSDFLGVAVSDAGDVNGDKCDDVIVGAVTTADYNAGAAYIFYGGGNLSLSSSINQLSLSQACKFSGVSYQFVGISVSGAGDVNKDGFADVIIGSSPSRASLSLSAFIVFGAATPVNGLLLSQSLNKRVTIVGGGAIVGRNGLGEVLIGIGPLGTTSTGIIVCTNVTIEKSTESPTVAPTVIPTVKSTRFPSPARTSVPSFLPSTVIPTVSGSNITDAPRMFSSEMPTLEPTIEPTESPTTSPSIEPSKRPSVSPTIALTLSPSESPSIRPTAVPSTGQPTQVELTRLPFRLPTIAPSNYTIPTVVEFLIDGKTRQVNDGLSLIDTRYLVNATGYVRITPTRGRCIYFIVPTSNMTLVIDRFNVSSDLIDLTLFANVNQYSDLIFTSGPVTITLPGDQTIQIVNPNSITLSGSNFVFNVPTESKTGESNSKSVVQTIVISLSVVALVVVSVLWRWYYNLKRKRISDLLNRKRIGMYNTDQYGAYIFEDVDEDSVNISDYTIEKSVEERMEEGSGSVVSGQALLSEHTIDSDGGWRAKEPGNQDGESKSEEMHPNDHGLRNSEWVDQEEIGSSNDYERLVHHQEMQEWHDQFDHFMPNSNTNDFYYGHYIEWNDFEAPRGDYYHYYIGNNHRDESY